MRTARIPGPGRMKDASTGAPPRSALLEELVERARPGLAMARVELGEHLVDLSGQLARPERHDTRAVQRLDHLRDADPIRGARELPDALALRSRDRRHDAGLLELGHHVTHGADRDVQVL